MKIAPCKVVWQHQRLPKTKGTTGWCGWMFQTGTWDRGKLHWTTIAMVPNSGSTEPSYTSKHSSLEHMMISSLWNWEYLLNIEPLNLREGEETHRTKNPGRFVQDEVANLPHDMGFVPWEGSEKNHHPLGLPKDPLVVPKLLIYFEPQLGAMISSISSWHSDSSAVLTLNWRTSSVR